MAITLASLRRQLDSAQPTFVLIDPLLGDPFHQSAPEADFRTERDSFWRRPTAVITAPSRALLNARQHPYLVELQGPQDPLLDMSVQHVEKECQAALRDGLAGDGGGTRTVGGWLQSACSLHALADRLSPLLKIQTTFPAPASYLRIADPRVLGLLRHVVGDMRLADALSFLSAWVYPTPDGALNRIQGQAQSTPCAWPLTIHEWTRLSQGEAFQRVLCMWLGELAQGGHAATAQQPNVTDGVFKALASAQEAARIWQHRFTRPQDEHIWATLQLLHPQLVPVPHSIQTWMADKGPVNAPCGPLRFNYPELVSLLRRMSPAPVSTADRVPFTPTKNFIHGFH